MSYDMVIGICTILGILIGSLISLVSIALYELIRKYRKEDIRDEARW